MREEIRLICNNGAIIEPKSNINNIINTPSLRDKNTENTQDSRLQNRDMQPKKRKINQSNTSANRLTPAQRMIIASRIQQDLETLHINQVISTQTIQQFYSTIRAIAAGYTLPHSPQTDPESDPPRAA